ncbi:hypothetical protein HN011_001395 [Eciton burchellii]|nr:hypothetical protein HN011_001395 [Eciton burchellii]
MERAVRLPAELLFLPPHSPTIPHPQYAAGRGWKSCLAAETRSPSFDESYVPAVASILPLPPPSLPHFAGRTTSNKGSLLACCSIILPKKTSNGTVKSRGLFCTEIRAGEEETPLAAASLLVLWFCLTGISRGELVTNRVAFTLSQNSQQAAAKCRDNVAFTENSRQIERTNKIRTQCCCV